jgi:hypothetical protein
MAIQEIKVASLYKIPSISRPADKPGTRESGPLTDSFTGLTHFDVFVSPIAA